tara:strand:- start:442 stop:747 length:306 start_codon:yes stop_codon:yes gene_type:complete
MNKTLLNKIRIYLTLHPETRDCDRKLTTMVWKGEVDKYGTFVSIHNFFDLYKNSKLTNSDSITRVRRKLQEEDKTLRGQKWYIRKNLQEQYRQKVIEYKYS